MEQPTKLFVYGIFLDENMREMYHMTNPKYDTVKDFATFGSTIVTAQYVPQAGLALTGVTVDYDPEQWERLDGLEGGYDRIIIDTTHGERAYMYAEKGIRGFTNHSTFDFTLSRPQA